jgi:glycosyltransferase involved in cell wall biosynthesis
MSNRKKTILFLSNESKLFGAPKVLLQIIKYFHSIQLYNLLVICPAEGPFKSTLDQNKIPTLIPDCLQKFYEHVSHPHFFPIQVWIRIWDNVKLFFYFYKLLKIQIDPVVYANTSVVRYIAIPAKISRAKLLWHVHEYFANPLKQWFHSFLIGHCADKIITHSPTLISRLHLSPRQIQKKVLHFGYFSAIEKDILPRVDSNTIEYDLLYAGRICLKKGVLDLLKAISNSIETEKELKAIFLGLFTEEDKQVILDFIAKNELENHVEFPGFVPDIYDYILRSRVVVLPTYRDYLPMLLLEALMLEKPIISTNVGDIPDVVVNNKNGFLIEPGDIHQLTDAIIRILDVAEYDRFKAGTKLMKAEILAKTSDYENLRQEIDSIN